MGHKLLLWLLAPVLALISNHAGAAWLNPENFPPRVERVAGTDPGGAERPWIVGKPTAPALRRIDFHDAIPELSPYPLPADPEVTPKSDPAFNDLLDGLKALSKNQLDEASYYFSEGVKKSPESESTDACNFWLGETRLKRGKYTEALTAYAEVEEGEYAEEALYRYARLADLERRGGLSRRAWETLAADPDGDHYPEARYRLGMAELLLGDMGSAGAHFEEALALLSPAEDSAAAATYQLALIKRETGHPSEAAGLLSRLLLTRPDHLAAPAATALLGWCELDLGNYEQARRRLSQVLEMELTSEALEVRALYGMARLYVAEGDDANFNEVLARLSLRTEGPWAGWSSADRAAVLFQKSRFEEALSLYKQALQLWKAPDADAVTYAAGETLIRLKRFGEAAALLGSIPAEAPLAPYGWKRGAGAYLSIGEGEKALGLYEKIVAQRPDFPEKDIIRVETAWLLLDQERAQEAQRVLLRTPEDTKGREALFYVNGALALKAGKWDEAARSFALFKTLDKEGKRNISAELNLAKALHMSGDYLGAAESYLAVADKTDDPGLSEKARLLGGESLLFTKDPGKGISILEKLTAENPKGENAAKANLFLAEFNFSGGRFGEALTRFEACLKYSTDPRANKHALIGKAKSLLALDQDKEALDIFETLDEDTDTLAGRAMALGKLGRLEEMAALLEHFETLYPGDKTRPRLQFQLAKNLLTSGNYIKAAELFGTLAKNTDQTLAGEAGLLEAEALDLGGRGEEATAVYEKLSGEAGKIETRAMALRALARRESKAGREEAALETLKNAFPWLSQREDLLLGVMNDAGERALALGDAQEALNILRRAKTLLQGGEEELRTDTLIGEALEKSGNSNAALETYLRIGYHYALNLDGAAAALTRAVEMLVLDGKMGEAREAYSRLENSPASAVWKEKAQKALQTVGE